MNKPVANDLSAWLSAMLAPDPGTVDRATLMARARFRASLIMVGVILGYVVLALRAVPLMLMPDDRLQAKAATQFQTAVEVEAPRGDILGRDGTVLATSVEMPALRADPSKLTAEQVGPLARELAGMLGLDAADLTEKLSKSERRDILLASQISPDAVDAVEKLVPGALWVDYQSTRFYPGRALAASLLGMVGQNNQGLEGIERSLDKQLRGSTYRFVQQRDRRGRNISTAGDARARAHAGDSVTLTIEPFIQRAAEDALDQMMITSAPAAAIAVVMDVKTGEILAIANRPNANPNDVSTIDVSAMRNRAVADAHEPGSVLKPFVVGLAVDKGINKAEDLIDCEGGSWRVGNSIINDDHPHGVVTLSEVVKYSSNIGTAKLAFAMGAEEMMAGLKRFGFTQPSGLNLPSEVYGFLRNPKGIRPIEVATTAFGQGMTATAVQLAAALAAVGNDGVRMKPYLVSEVRDRLGYVRLRNRPVRVERVISEEAADSLVKMMITVLETGGTGTKARPEGFSAAGKTGTAQKVVDGHYSATARVSSFIGLTPANDPRLAIVVIGDTPTIGSKYGGIVAGPGFSLIATRALRYLGVPEDVPIEPKPKLAPPPPALGPDGLPLPVVPPPMAMPAPVKVAPGPAQLTWLADGRMAVPDLTGRSMRDVLVAVDGAGVEVHLVGSGRVVSQNPAPGYALAAGDRLEVVLQ